MSVVDLDQAAPMAGELQRINEHIFWLRMPLPFELDHINLYLIKDGSHYVAVDTGLGTEETANLWQKIFDDYDITLSGVIVTHMHPDHIGTAGYLVDKFRVPFYMSHGEYYVARTIVAGRQGASDWQDRAFYQQCGLPEKYIQKSLSSKHGIANVVNPVPVAFSRLTQDQQIKIGDYQWRIIIGRGHSPEHVCLYCEALNVLISGDHVLPQITPNIGVYSTEPNNDALKQYLSTLPPLYDISSSVLVLPAHRQPFTGLHTRISQLIAHHYEHLNALQAYCAEPRTVNDCLPVLFKRTLNHQAMFFAVAECLSHLNYLMYDGALSRTLYEDGTFRYSQLRPTHYAS